MAEALISAGYQGSAAVYHAAKVGMLSDGTLLTTVRTNASTVTVFYSTDQGASWTACATTFSVSSSQGHQHILFVDPYDNIFITTVPGSTLTIRALTFNGADVTQQSAFDTTSANRERGSGFAIDNPTRSGNYTNVLITGASGSSGDVHSIDYDRDTQTFSTGTYISIGSISVNSNSLQPLLALLQSSTDDYRVPLAPSTPKGALITQGNATGQINGRALNWNATFHRFELGSLRTVTAPQTGGLAAAYYAPEDRYLVGAGASTTSGQTFSFDSSGSAFTVETDATWTSDGDKTATLQFVTDGLILHAAHHSGVQNNWQLYADPGFGSETAKGASTGLFATYAVGHGYGWISGVGRFQCVLWADGSGNARSYTEWTDFGGGAFVGFGIPMGIA